MFVPALIVHGGAGARGTPADRAARRRGMLIAARRGAEILRGGGSALDAAIAAVTALEDDPYFNAGYGSVLNVDGKIEMDAGVMVAEPRRAIRTAADGTPSPQRPGFRTGAVAAVSRVRNPILLARAVMERTRHILMVGEGAERFARECGVPLCRPRDLITPRAIRSWRRWAAQNAAARMARNGPRYPFLEKGRRASGGRPKGALAHGTVGAAAVDSHGALAAATSTGGYSGKLAGRVGDSPILGAGFFAAKIGAASATGVGEAIMKLGLCRDAVAALEHTTPATSAIRAIAAISEIPGAVAGIIVVDRKGRVGYAHNAESMEVAIFDAEDGVRHMMVKPHTRAKR